MYYNLLTSGKLNSYLSDIDQQTKDMFIWLVKEMGEKQGVTERLKAADQMAWVGKINAICSTAMEIVNNEVIYI